MSMFPPCRVLVKPLTSESNCRHWADALGSAVVRPSCSVEWKATVFLETRALGLGGDPKDPEHIRALPRQNPRAYGIGPREKRIRTFTCTIYNALQSSSKLHTLDPSFGANIAKEPKARFHDVDLSALEATNAHRITVVVLPKDVEMPCRQAPVGTRDLEMLWLNRAVLGMGSAFGLWGVEFRELPLLKFWPQRLAVAWGATVFAVTATNNLPGAASCKPQKCLPCPKRICQAKTLERF